jgi:hypothetical protein
MLNVVMLSFVAPGWGRRPNNTDFFTKLSRFTSYKQLHPLLQMYLAYCFGDLIRKNRVETFFFTNLDKLDTSRVFDKKVNTNETIHLTKYNPRGFN